MNITGYQQWVDNYHAEYDFLKFANENYYPKALNEMCFHGQQVIEKALKSYLILRDHSESIRHHDLIRLAHEVSEVDDNIVFTPDELKSLGAISNFAVNTRYPQEYPCTESDLHLTLSFCEKITTRIERVSTAFIKRENSVDFKIERAKEREFTGNDSSLGKGYPDKEDSGPSR